MLDQYACQRGGGVNPAAMQRGSIRERPFHQGARHKKEQYPTMKTPDCARLIHVQREDTWHLRYVRRVEPSLAAQELPRWSFKEHAEADVADALGRNPTQRSYGQVRAGAEVEEAQIADRVTRQ